MEPLEPPLDLPLISAQITNVKVHFLIAVYDEQRL